MSGGGGALFRANAEQIRFASMLAARYRSGAPLFDPDDALIQDPDWWRKVMNDPSIAHAIRQRLAKVVRDDWSMKPGGEDEDSRTAAMIFEAMFRKIRLFGASRRHLAKFAFHGNAHAWIEGKRQWCSLGASKENPAGFLAEWWIPTYVKPLDKRQLLLVPILDPAGKKVRVEMHMATIDGGTHVPIVNPECLLSAVYDDEVERLGSGRGLSGPIYYGYWEKCNVNELWLRGVARWAMGVVVGKIDAEARGKTTADTESVVDQMQTTLKKMGEGGVLTIDKRDEIDVLFGNESGTGGAKAAMEYIDEKLVQLVLGAVLPTGSASGVGSKARAETESDSTDDLLDSDREMLDEAITRKLVKLAWDLNEANLVACGLPGAQMPSFTSQSVHEETTEEAGEALKTAQDLGLEIAAEEAYRRMRLTRPAENEEKLERPAPESPFGGGGFPGLPKDVPPQFAEMGVTGDAWTALCALVRHGRSQAA